MVVRALGTYPGLVFGIRDYPQGAHNLVIVKYGSCFHFLFYVPRPLPIDFFMQNFMGLAKKIIFLKKFYNLSKNVLELRQWYKLTNSRENVKIFQKSKI